MKLLKTRCSGCCFKNGNKCSLNKDVFLDQNIVFTSGYCKEKRDNKWLENNQVDKLYDENININIILDENNIHLLDYYLYYDDLKFHPIIILNDKPKEYLNILLDKLKQSNREWSIDNLLLKPEELLDKDLVNHSMNFVKFNWFIYPKYKLDYQYLIQIKNKLLSNANILGFYNEKLSLFNKFAFMDIKGNYYEPFMDKIKTFDNWKDVCLTI